MTKYEDELYKFINKDVIVIHEGNEYKGKLRGIDRTHCNIILMTNKEKIFIKGFYSMRRKRTNEGDVKNVDSTNHSKKR